MQRIILISVLCVVFSIQLKSQTPINKDAKKYYQTALQLLEKKSLTDDQINSALDNLGKAFVIDSGFSDIQFYLGMAYYYQKSYPAAHFCFSKYKSQTKNLNSDYFLYEGIVKYKLTDNNVAQELLQFYSNTVSGGTYKDSLARSEERRVGKECRL